MCTQRGSDSCRTVTLAWTHRREGTQGRLWSAIIASAQITVSKAPAVPGDLPPGSFLTRSSFNCVRPPSPGPGRRLAESASCACSRHPVRMVTLRIGAGAEGRALAVRGVSQPRICAHWRVCLQLTPQLQVPFPGRQCGIYPPTSYHRGVTRTRRGEQGLDQGGWPSEFRVHNSCSSWRCVKIRGMSTSSLRGDSD